MFNFKEELKKIEKKHGIRVCSHDLIEQGFLKLTVHPIVKRKKEKILLPEAMKNEIKKLLAVEHCTNLTEKILIFFGLEKFIRFPVVTFSEGITMEEILQRQENWSAVHNMGNE